MLVYKSGPKIEVINLAQFKSKVNINALGTLKKEFVAASTSKSKVMAINTAETYLGFKIITDSIKVIKAKGHTMYIFPVVLPSKRATSFQNLTIDESAVGTVAFVNTYTGGTSPTPPPTYNPCPGAPPLVSGKKSLGNKIMVGPPPTECDSVPVEPNLDLLPFDRLKYPNLAKIVDGLYDKVKNNPKLMAALKNFTHLTEQQILSNLEPGKGPKVTVRDMPNIAGHYDKATNTIQIGKHLVSASNYLVTSYPTALEFYMGVSILHEFIHFGENYTQTFLPHDGNYDDAGFQFENSYYGGKVYFNYATGSITYER